MSIKFYLQKQGQVRLLPWPLTCQPKIHKKRNGEIGEGRGQGQGQGAGKKIWSVHGAVLLRISSYLVGFTLFLLLTVFDTEALGNGTSLCFVFLMTCFSTDWPIDIQYISINNENIDLQLSTQDWPYLSNGWNMTVIFLAPGLHTNFVPPPSIKLSSGPPSRNKKRERFSLLETVQKINWVYVDKCYMGIRRTIFANSCLQHIENYFEWLAWSSLTQ